MPLRRSPPPQGTASPTVSLTHCKQDSNLSPPSSGKQRNLVVSEPNITQRRRRKNDEESTGQEVLELFKSLKKEQDEKFEALMNKVQSGINKHTEQNANIVSSIEFLSQKYEEAISRINTLEQKISSDEKYIRSLETKLELMDRSLHSSSIEVRNVPKKTAETKEDLLNMVKTVGDALNLQIQPSEIRDVYRINTKNEANQAIVAQFSTVVLRDKIIGNVKAYNKKYKTSKFSTTNLKIEGPPKPIFVSESLTMQAKKLFFLAREFSKINNYKYCWVSRGKIYLRRTDGSTLIRINKESDLETLKNK